MEASELNVGALIARGHAVELVRAASARDERRRFIVLRSSPHAEPSIAASAIENARDIARRHSLGCMLELRDAVTGLASDAALVYADGGGAPLRDWLAEAPGAMIDVALAVAGALSEVHAAGLTCLNLRTDIVWYDGQRAKLLDFSSATFRAREQLDISSPWSLRADLRYLAPEQTGRMNRTVDFRADYYSLGVVLYELATGALPFEAADPLDLIYAQLTQRPEPVEARAPRTDPFFAAIILKLLEKDPSRRYQSAEGLAADLLRVRSGGASAPLARVPGQYDLVQRFDVPSKLYGRSEERTLLISAYERASSGGRELVLLSGYPGIGKSSLIRETYLPITRHRSLFVGGKFDQLGRRVPYSAWLSILSGLTEMVLMEPRERLARWRERLGAALGPNGGVLSEVVPLLSTLVGEQPLPEALPAGEAKGRFLRTVAAFVASFCGKGQPLVVFLDDIQWADAASLDLLEALASDVACGPLFLIAAYRDNDLSSIDPLRAVLERLETSPGLRVTRVSLAPLGVQALTEMVADTFCADPSRAVSLAERVAQKTRGNPFFVWQLLRALHASGTIRFDARAMRWDWSLDEIDGIPPAENVLDLVIDSLHRLPNETRAALGWAACVGNQFGVGLLSELMGSTEAVTARRVAHAVESDLIVPMRRAASVEAQSRGGWYRFAHDRIQEAAYQTLSRREAIAAHLSIARRLAAGRRAEELGQSVFEVADQLNRAREAIREPSERIEFAQINLLASRRALEASAFAAALGYIQSAMEDLPNDIWSVRQELARELFRARSECEYLNGDIDSAKRYARDALAHESDRFIRADWLNMLVVHSTLRSAYDEAIASGLAALESFSVVLPENQLEALRDAELDAIQSALAQRPLSSLAPFPEMQDREQRMIFRLLAAMGPPCYRSHARLWGLNVAYQVRRCLTHGFVATATYSLPAYGGLLMQLGRGSARECETLRQATLSLARQMGSAADRSVAHLMIASSLMHWYAPLGEASEEYRHAYSAGLESGNLQYAAYALAHRAYCRYFQGIPLDRLAAETRESYEFCVARGNRWGSDLAEGMLRVVEALRSGMPMFTWNDSPETEFLARCRERGNVQVLGIYFIVKADALVHLGRYEEAAHALQKSEMHLDCVRAPGLYPFAHHHILAALLMLVVPAAFELTAEAGLARAQGLLTRVEEWASDCPANFSVAIWLLRAESARQRGELRSALDAYDQAIATASARGQHPWWALANARVAAFWSDDGRAHYAQPFRARADMALRSWRGVPASGAAAGAAFDLEGSVEQKAALDLQSVLRAAQAFARSVELGDVVGAIIASVARVSGAGRVVLLLPNGGELALVADTAAPAAELSRVRVAGPDRVPQALLHYTTRTLRIERAQPGTEVYERDSYLRSQRPASALCVPIVLAGSLEGILYLEHASMGGAFAEERLELVEFLAGNAAIAVRNAELVGRLRSDIERRIEAELRLTESERRHRLSMEESPFGIQVFDGEGRLCHTNRAWGQIGGPEPSLSSELATHPLLAREDSSVCARILRGETVELGERALGGSPGSERWARGRVYAVRDASGALEQFVLMLEDVSERRQLERLKSEFVSTVSHELRTPLTSVIGALGLLAEGIGGPLNPQAAELIVMAHDNARQLARLVDDILDLDRLTRGTYRFTPRRLSVAMAAEEAIQKLSVYARKHAVTLRLDLDADDSATQIFADPDRVAQVLGNYLSNAIKFSEAGRDVSVRAVRLPNAVRVEVRDRGVGVPLEFRSSLFEPFAQADGSSRRRYQGTGLGLSITRRIVEQMGGAVGFEPLEPSGSCFYFELPAAGASDAEAERATPPW